MTKDAKSTEGVGIFMDKIRARREAQEAEYKKFESECRGRTCHRLLSAGVVDTCKGDSCMRWAGRMGCIDNLIKWSDYEIKGPQEVGQ